MGQLTECAWAMILVKSDRSSEPRADLVWDADAGSTVN